jgi:hypothetical protein
MSSFPASISVQLMKKLSHTQKKDMDRSRLIAQEAEQDEQVRQFRRDILGPKLLAQANVKQWVLETHAADKATIDQNAPVPVPRHVQRALASDRVHTIITKPARIRVDNVVPVCGGVLSKLNRVAEDLAGRYGWQEEAAIEFVLTGKTPLISSLTAEPMPDGFILRVHHSIGPRELADFYRSERKRLAIKNQRARRSAEDLNRKSEGQQKRRAKANLLRPMFEPDNWENNLPGEVAGTLAFVRKIIGVKDESLSTRKAKKEFKRSRATLYRHARAGKVQRNKNGGAVRWRLK